MRSLWKLLLILSGTIIVLASLYLSVGLTSYLGGLQYNGEGTTFIAGMFITKFLSILINLTAFGIGMLLLNAGFNFSSKKD